MKPKIIQVIVLVVVFSAIGGGVYIRYQNTPIQIEKEKRVVCSDPNHQGDRVLKTTIETIRVPRREVDKYQVITTETVCQVCKARREEEFRQAKIRREREEREARERARQAAVRREEEAQQAAILGMWVRRGPIDIVLTFRSGGTGEFAGEKINWKYARGNIVFQDRQGNTYSCRITSSGQQLILMGWEPMFGPNREAQSIFDRLE